MKKSFLGLVVVFAAFFLNSCIGPCGRDRSEATATNFLNAIRLREIGKAQSMCTDHGRNIIRYCIKHSIDYKIYEVNNVKCEVNGDKATCTFCCSTQIGDQFTLVRDKGEIWLVDDISCAIYQEKYKR